MKNGIILCETTKGKIIGGYSPIPFSSNSLRNEQIVDPLNQPFVFSLSNNDKFAYQQGK